MVPGFNTDFKYRGQTFHVQTEDNGTGNPVVVTLLYHKGAILASRKTSYADLLGQGDHIEPLKEMMKSQHKALMRELLAGTYDAKIPAAPTVAAGAPSPAAAAAVAVGPAPPPDAPVAAPVAAPATAAAPRAPQRHRPAGGLHDAIMRYLEEFAAAAAAH